MKLQSGLVALLVLTACTVSAQQKNSFSLFYEVSNANINIHDVIGDYGYAQRPGSGFGLTYDGALNKFFSIETGFTYADDESELSFISASPGGGIGTYYSPVEMKTISIPLRGRFTFLKYFFADAGLSLDKQVNYNSNSGTNDQSGLGGELGVGAQVKFSHFLVFVNPYYRNYRITSTQNTLFESGVKFGIGYAF